MSASRVPCRRRGISLLEVLISMFILLIGLLGVASLLPVGRFELVQAAKYDQGSAVGQAAYRELKVLGLLDPTKILYSTDPSSSTLSLYQAVNATDGTSLGPANGASPKIPFPPLIVDPLVMDPLLMIKDPTALSVALQSPPPTGSYFPHCFPYSVGALSSYTNVPWINRATVANPFLGPTTPMPVAIAEQIFRTQDDLYYSVPTGTNDTVPEQRFITDTSSPPNPIRRIATGDYSWMYTLSRDATIHYADPSADPRDLLLSVVVFYKRQLRALPLNSLPSIAPPTERVVYVNNVQGGIGGGELLLSIPTTGSTIPVAQDPSYLDVRVGQWILLGWVEPPSSSPPPRWTLPPSMIRWYRVVAVQKDTQLGTDSFTSQPAWQRYITVAGPDWYNIVDPWTGPPVVPTPTQAIPPYNPTMAFLCDGAISVYEKNLRVQTP